MLYEVITTPLVGREHEVNVIIRQLQEPACRLLTLTGPGGMWITKLCGDPAYW